MNNKQKIQIPNPEDIHIRDLLIENHIIDNPRVVRCGRTSNKVYEGSWGLKYNPYITFCGSWECRVCRSKLLEKQRKHHFSNNIEFILTAGNEVFNTYMKVNEPVTGIVTERPIFTNVNNGVGLFASKYKKSINSYMAVNSILELCLGERTGHLKFCCDSVNYYNAIIELDAKGYDVTCD